jgi:hypothetical protein
MMSPLRGQSGRSGESEDSKTDNNASGHSRSSSVYDGGGGMPPPSPYLSQRPYIPTVPALKRRASGETLAEIAKSYAVDISMISRLR